MIYEIIIVKATFHFLYKQLKTIDGVLSSWNLVLITVMYITRVLPAPWSVSSLNIILFSLLYFQAGE